MLGKGSFLALVESFLYAQKFLVDDAEGFERAFQAADKSTLIVVLANEDIAEVLPRPAETP